MAKLLKLRRGTTTQHGSFTGAEGEVTIDTTKDTAVVHDGSQAGGRPLAREDMNNVSSANILGRISNGDIVGTKLENSGVTAGSYGSSSAIPIVTVDAQGLVTAASTTAIDSTTIANGTSNVAVANNGDITTTRSGTARLVVDNAGVDVTGTLDVSGQTNVNSGVLRLGTADTASGHLNSYEVMTFNIDSDNDDTNRYFGFYKDGSSGSGTELFKVEESGQATVSGNLDVGAGLDVTGNITATGTLSAGGDITLNSSANNQTLTIKKGTTVAAMLGHIGSGDEGFLSLKDGGTDTLVMNGETNGISYINSGNFAVGKTTASEKLDVNGNIAVSGTVDGVDIAAFKTAFDEAFPSGTKMLFQQTSAPTGWTKVTSGVDNKALRVVSGAAGSGGTNQFSNTFASVGITANAGNATAGGNVTVANATVTGNVSIDSVSTSGNVNSHTLSSNEMPSHRHNLTRNNNSNYWNSRNNIAGFSGMPSYSWINANSQYSGTGGTAFYTDHTGGGGGHTHGFTGSSHTHSGTLSAAAHTHNASFTGSAHNHSISVNNIDLTVQYLDVIIASKD